MNIPFLEVSLTRVLFGTRTLGLAAVGLAAAAGILTGSELYLALQAASALLAHGDIYFWPVVLGLIGLALDVGAAGVAVVGGGLMVFQRRTGRRLVVSALAAGIAGETVLAFADRGQFTRTTSSIWIGLLVGAYLLLLVSAFLQRRR